MSRLVTPGSTVTRWFGMSTSSTRLRRASAMTSAARDRQRAARQAGAVSARRRTERRARAHSLHDRLHLRGRGRQDDGGRRLAEMGQRVAFARQQLECVLEDACVADNPPQFRRETRGPCRFRIRGRLPDVRRGPALRGASHASRRLSGRQYNPRIRSLRGVMATRRVSRRQFLEGTGTALTVAAVAPALRAQPSPSAPADAHLHHADRERREAHRSWSKIDGRSSRRCATISS